MKKNLLLVMLISLLMLPGFVMAESLKSASSSNESLINRDGAPFQAFF